ncbi:MAG: hypothetical protein FWE28_07205 [Oscillospiraceae bacterium]|nr:hypothetical protein [Oscillospiraceae bacterium]
MDEYRGRFANHNHHREPPQQPQPPPPEPHIEPSSKGLLGNFGIGGDFLGEYLPILLIILGAVGVYLMLGKGDGLGSLLGGLFSS